MDDGDADGECAAQQILLTVPKFSVHIARTVRMIFPAASAHDQEVPGLGLRLDDVFLLQFV